MNSERPSYLYFIGIGGIGMSGLARYYRRRGSVVAGYDRTPSELIGQLRMEGIEVQFDENPSLIPSEFQEAHADQVLVVRTPAVPISSPLLKYWEDKGARILKRSEVLGMITRDRRTIAVAGTHGKTTVSTMLAYLLTEGGVKCNAFLGGISANYGTNVLLNDDAVVNVVEADEYDRSFLRLSPSEAIITAMDPDHLDIYGTPEAMYAAYGKFATLVTGKVLVHERISSLLLNNVDSKEIARRTQTYSINATNEPRAENIRVADGTYRFDLVAEGRTIKDISMGMPGRHNVENAIAASAMALSLGVPNDKLHKALASFRGVSRRFELRAKTDTKVFIDDYAHHPAELVAAISSAKELYPGRKVTGIFQPHLFSRTRDLVLEFGQALALLDELILLDIYPAREEPIPGVTSRWMLEYVPMMNKTVCTKENLLPLLRNRKLDILLALGAGDIDRLVPGIAALIEEV